MLDVCVLYLYSRTFDQIKCDKQNNQTKTFHKIPCDTCMKDSMMTLFFSFFELKYALALSLFICLCCCCFYCFFFFFWLKCICAGWKNVQTTDNESVAYVCLLIDAMQNYIWLGLMNKWRVVTKVTWNFVLSINCKKLQFPLSVLLKTTLHLMLPIRKPATIVCLSDWAVKLYVFDMKLLDALNSACSQSAICVMFLVAHKFNGLTTVWINKAIWLRS